MFYGRIIGKERDHDFQSMVTDLAAHYAEKRPAALRVEEGGLYVVQEEAEFHRWDLNSSRSRACLSRVRFREP